MILGLGRYEHKVYPLCGVCPYEMIPHLIVREDAKEMGLRLLILKYGGFSSLFMLSWFLMSASLIISL